MERRECLKIATAATATGVLLGGRAMAAVKEFNTYKPTTANFREVHRGLIVIDGCTNLFAQRHI